MNFDPRFDRLATSGSKGEIYHVPAKKRRTIAALVREALSAAGGPAALVSRSSRRSSGSKVAPFTDGAGDDDVDATGRGDSRLRSKSATCSVM